MAVVKKLNLESDEVLEAVANQSRLAGIFGARNTLNDEYDKIYNMDWSFTGELEGIDTILTTVSPSIRNRILGMRRLLDSTEILIKVDSQDIAFDKDKLERSLSRWFQQTARISKKNLLSDLALSALLYGEIQVGLDNTKVKAEGVIEARKKRALAVAEQIPYLTTTWHPNEGMYESDEYGLTVFSRTTQTTWGNIRSNYAAFLGSEYDEKKSSDTAELTRYWSLEHFIIMVDGKPVYAKLHGLNEIPVIVQLVDGSQLFEEIETQRQSVMFAVNKAGYFDQQSTLLTLMSSIIFAMGVAPMYKHQLPPSDELRQLEIDYSKPGGVINLLPGETFDPVDNRGLIDPSVRELYQKNELAIEEATVYNTALGAPVESNIAFSTVSLLAQQGRLPLSGPQRAIGYALSAVMELGIRLLKNATSSFNKNGIDLTPASMPDDLQISASIDIKLPQDKLQLANIAHMLKSDNLTDLEWIQTNILNITDTSTMNKNILRDKMLTMLSDVKIAALLEQYKNSMAVGQAGATPGVTPGVVPQGTPGVPPASDGVPGQVGMPSEQLGMANTGTPPPGVQGGLPSAELGMLPSQGRGTIPMEGM